MSLIESPVVFREKDYDWIIYTNDHPPPHCHIVKDRKTKGKIVFETLIFARGCTIPEHHLKTLQEITRTKIK